MHNAFFYGNVDITEIILSVFVLFFLGLIIYLRREDRREGYPP
jgi:photosynthetic reaction center H subunit